MTTGEGGCDICSGIQDGVVTAWYVSVAAGYAAMDGMSGGQQAGEDTADGGGTSCCVGCGGVDSGADVVDANNIDCGIGVN